MSRLLSTVEGYAGTILCLAAAVLLLEMAWYFIGKRKKQSRKSTEQDSYHNDLMNQIKMFYLVICVDTRELKEADKTVEAMFGISQAEVEADVESLYRITDKEHARIVRNEIEHWNRKEQLEQTFPYENLKTKEKFQGRMTLVLTEDQKHAILMIEDVTEQVQEREQLQTEIKRVYELDKSKTAFLSQMSHEIRTPMNGMLGMISLAKMNIDKKEEAADYLDKASGLSQFLLSIINDILDMSRIESGRMELASEKVDVYGIADKIRSMFQVTIEEKGVQFSLELQDISVRYFMGDELRISQVLTNLLSNASKFTPAGGKISVTIRQMLLLDKKVNYMFRVQDTGKGMSSEFLSKLFQPFSQEDAGIARKYGGSGLGMAISDNLVHMMGGQITVNSELEKGTDFKVFLEVPIAAGDQTLPNEQNAAQRVAVEEEVSISGLRILMAEDNKINAVIAVKHLNVLGAEVETAGNGQEAMDKFTEHEPGYYDVILMDIQMPVLDGWSAAKKIRAYQRADAKTIPIIALSADAFVEDKRKSVEMGMNAHVAKPIDFKELKRVIREYVA